MNEASLMETRRDEILLEYQAMAEHYDQGSEACGWKAPALLVKTLNEKGMIKPGMQVVDFATGTGELARAFRQSGATGKSLHITATDLSPAMLDQCRGKGIADELVQQDITQRWAVAENSQDIVAATGVAEYLTDGELAEAVREAAHSLKSGGKLAFTFLPAAEGERPSGPGEQQQHQMSYVRKICEQNDIRLESADIFDAYRSDAGSMVQHVLAVGLKL